MFSRQINLNDMDKYILFLKVFGIDGSLKATHGQGEFDYPFSVAIDAKGYFVVSDPAINKITILNASGKLFRRFR